jgi:hypothetical protein
VPNGRSVSHDAEKFCLVCNKLREKSIFVNFRKNIRLFIFFINFRMIFSRLFAKNAKMKMFVSTQEINKQNHIEGVM